MKIEERRCRILLSSCAEKRDLVSSQVKYCKDNDDDHDEEEPVSGRGTRKTRSQGLGMILPYHQLLPQLNASQGCEVINLITIIRIRR